MTGIREKMAYVNESAYERPSRGSSAVETGNPYDAINPDIGVRGVSPNPNVNYLTLVSTYSNVRNSADGNSDQVATRNTHSKEHDDITNDGSHESHSNYVNAGEDNIYDRIPESESRERANKTHPRYSLVRVVAIILSVFLAVAIVVIAVLVSLRLNNNSNGFETTVVGTTIFDITKVTTGTTSTAGIPKHATSNRADVTTMPQATHTTVREISCALDLAFVVDSSGSINDKDPRNWNLTLSFLRYIAENVNILEIRLSALSFSNNAIIGFDFDNGFTTKDEYYAAINRLRYDGGTTNTTGALRAARTRLFTPLRGDRPEVPNFMMVMTDGRNNVEDMGFVQETQNVKNSSIRVMALGVTTDVSVTELEQMASTDRNGNPLVYVVDDFVDLNQEFFDILTTANICELS